MLCHIKYEHIGELFPHEFWHFLKLHGAATFLLDSNHFGFVEFRIFLELEEEVLQIRERIGVHIDL